jgi:hypothetical protein
MTERQKLIDAAIEEALNAIVSRDIHDNDPFEEIKRRVLGRVEDANLLDFRSAAQRWIRHREFGMLIVDLALTFADPHRPNEPLREILMRADQNGSASARTLLDWFSKL